MSDREAYSWTLLRLVPRIERGEQINIGAVVFSRRHDFLGLELVIDEPRLLAFAPDLDLPELRTQLAGLERVAAGDPAAGRVAGMSTGDRFGFLAAPSNTILQASPVHVGLCVDPAEALERLVERYVRVSPVAPPEFVLPPRSEMPRAADLSERPSSSTLGVDDQRSDP